MNEDYEKILCTKRLRDSTIKRKLSVEEFYSDRSRILYSSSFRRLQQKAQVFSLEPNSSVRTRLTHSLEVSDIGRTLANKIGYKLIDKKYIKESLVPMIVSVVENACLLHDIGNPPFGHFGEAAIQEWAKSNLEKLAKKASINVKSELYKLLTSDFIEFDGNPQGFRVVSKLHCEQDEYSLNLTYATLLCGLKYSRAAGEKEESGILKKAGYFQSEKDLVEKMQDFINIKYKCRYPLTYIMEAADDIAYCLSDISDGIEKRIIKPIDFINEFKYMWNKDYSDINCPINIPDNIENFNLDIAVKWSREIIDETANEYIQRHIEFCRGEAKQLIKEDGMGRVLETIKKVARKLLYKSLEAESIELTGYAVITGLLTHFGRLLALSYKDFSILTNDAQTNDKVLDFERRLFNRLGKRYVKCYILEVNKLNTDPDEFIIKEWWLRTHLIIDHITGMTDDYALATYQVLMGINIKIN